MYKPQNKMMKTKDVKTKEVRESSTKILKGNNVQPNTPNK